MTGQGADDALFESFVQLICADGRCYAHEVEDGVIMVVFEDMGDLRRVELLVSRRQLREMVGPDDVQLGSDVRARLEAPTTGVEEALLQLRFDEPFVVLSEGALVGSTRRELPPSPGTPDPFDGVEGGFWSAHPVDDPRYGEPGSIFGARPGGETDTMTLLVSMSPLLEEGPFVFCDVDGDPVDVDPVVRIREEGSTTLVVPQQVADGHGWEYAGVTSMVTLPVHSAPGAVDLTSDITGALFERGISCRFVAGLRNDRLFVPHGRGWNALQALEDLRDVATGPG